jgi:nucleotide-binding universal stress UspA family protein
MEEIKKILAPTDLSELSKLGVRYALKLAKAIEAEVTVYHAVDYETLTRYGQRSAAPASFQPAEQQFLDRYQNALTEFMADCACDVDTSVKARQKVELGIPDESIVELAKSQGYDLIVMSTHGKTGVRMTLGSVTETVVRTAPCPVLSIGPVTAPYIAVSRSEYSERHCSAARREGEKTPRGRGFR